MGIILNIFYALVFIVVIWIWWRKRKFSIFEKHGIPGPKPNFWNGNLSEMFEKRRSCIQEYLNKYGSTIGCFIGAKPLVFTIDPDLLKIILVKEFELFTNRDPILPDFGIPEQNMVEYGLGVAKDDQWKNTRDIISPSFTSAKLRKMMPIVNGVTDIFLERIAEKSKNKESFNLYPIFKNLVLDSVTKSFFGIDTNVQYGKNSSFVDSATLFFGNDSANPLFTASICFPELEPIPTKLRCLFDWMKYKFNLPSVRSVLNAVEDRIVHRKKSSQKLNDLLQSVIEEKIKKVSLSNKSATCNLTLLMVAGYDTTSATLGFVCYYVSRYPEIQEKIRNEINEYFKDNREVEYEDLVHFQYLEQVISETLRLHSLTDITVNRIVKKSTEFKGMIIPKGVTIAVPLDSLHRNHEYWSDPEIFNPERFSPENKSKINPLIYQPFGFGPRNCIGMRYAQTVMRLVLVRLLRSYKLEYCSANECEVNYSLFINHPKEVVIKAILI